MKAGTLAGFARTAHCNDFFINHGEIDERLLSGLDPGLRGSHALGTDGLLGGRPRSSPTRRRRGRWR